MAQQFEHVVEFGYLSSFDGTGWEPVAKFVSPIDAREYVKWADLRTRTFKYRIVTEKGA